MLAVLAGAAGGAAVVVGTEALKAWRARRWQKRMVEQWLEAWKAHANDPPQVIE